MGSQGINVSLYKLALRVLKLIPRGPMYFLGISRHHVTKPEPSFVEEILFGLRKLQTWRGWTFISHTKRPTEHLANSCPNGYQNIGQGQINKP